MTVSDELEDAINAARAGDSRGFEVLFRAFGAPVAGYMRARGVSDPDGIANDVFLRAFRTIQTFRGDATRFRAWLFTIAHHAAVDDARRRHHRVREVPVEHAPEPVGGDVESEVMVHLAQQRVHDLLSGLSADQRDVLMLRVVADLSLEDTATILRKNPDAVKKLQRRGLAALRRAISLHEAVPQ
jgi:RNA polymerase sigma factor (sigma-70 family)